MHRFGIALIATLVPLVAVAKWQVLNVPGQGRSVWIADAGDFAVATTSGAYRVQADGGISQEIELSGGTAGMLDAFVDGRGCFVALPKLSFAYLVYADPACGPTSAVDAGQVAAETPVRMRRAHGGAAYLTATDPMGVQSFFFAAPDGIPADGFVPLPVPSSPAKPSTALGAVHVGTGDVALAGINSPGFPLAWIVDAGTPIFQHFASSQAIPLELALIDSSSALLTVNPGQLVQIGGLGTSAPTWNPLTLGDSVLAVGFAPNTDLDQVGLGMAGSASAGPAPFQFAMPIPGAPGASWTANPQVPTYSGVVSSVDCTADGICAAVTNAADAGNLVVYTNAAAPTWSPPSVIWTDAGTTVPLSVTPSDLDGDPLVVSWSANPPISVQPLTLDGTSINLNVAGSATSCDQPWIDYPVAGALADGLASHRDTRTVTVRVIRVFSPLSAATPMLDAGYQPATAALEGTVDALNVNCALARGLSAEVALAVNGTAQGTQRVGPLPAPFSFSRSSCLAATYAVTAQIVDGDGGVGPSTQGTFEVPGQPAGISGVSGGPLVARCGQGAQGTLQVVVPAGSCPAQSLEWKQQGGPALVQGSGTGAVFAVATQDTSLENLIGEQIQLEVSADAGTTAATFHATVPIAVDPFIAAVTDVETPVAQSGAPLGVRVTVENPTTCPISQASLEEQVEDGELVEGSARIDGRPASARVESGRVIVDGLELAAGERHQVTFDVQPHVLGRPAPSAKVVFRGVPISRDATLQAAPTSAGCSCRSTSGGGETFGCLLLGGALLLERRRRKVVLRR